VTAETRSKNARAAAVLPFFVEAGALRSSSFAVVRFVVKFGGQGLHAVAMHPAEAG